MTASGPAVSVIGLGRVGLCLAAAVAQAGLRVVGYDCNPARRAALLAGDPNADEPGLDQILAAHRTRLTLAESIGDAVRETDLSIVVVQTPSSADGRFSTRHVADALSAIGAAIALKSGYHLVSLASTVAPGTTRAELLPLLAAVSGKACGADFGFCYNPVFVALGRVIPDFLRPAFVLIGETDERAGETLAALYGHLVAPAVPRKRMSIENAELTKLAVNTFVTTKIVYANMLADLCEALEGGDADVVADAVGCDPRIGPQCLRGGLGYGGPCFPRDNAALTHVARRLGVSAALAEVTDLENRARPSRLAARLPDALVAGRAVAVLGLAYKSGTVVAEASQSVVLANLLADRAASVTVFDPMAAAGLRDGPGGALDVRVRIAPNLPACVAHAETILVTTPEPVFDELPAVIPRRAGRQTTIVDFWRRIQMPADRDDLRLLALGRAREDEDGPGAPVATAFGRAADGRFAGLALVTVVSWPFPPQATVERNLDLALGLLAGLPPGSTDLVCLPEGCLTSGVNGAPEEVPEDLVALDVADRFGAVARRLGALLAIPTVERSKTGRTFVAVALVDRHGVRIGTYGKRHPWPCEPALTRLEFGAVPGDSPCVFETELGTIGVQACFDVNFDSGWREIAAAAAKLVLFPSAYAAGFALRARAWTCQTVIAASALGGGPSRVIDVDGRVVARVREREGARTIPVNLNVCLVHRDHNTTFLANLARKCPELTIRPLPDDNVVRIEAPPGWGCLEDFLDRCGARTLRRYLRESAGLLAGRYEIGRLPGGQA